METTERLIFQCFSGQLFIALLIWRKIEKETDQRLAISMGCMNQALNGRISKPPTGFTNQREIRKK